jgi:hypothetical protein
MSKLVRALVSGLFVVSAVAAPAVLGTEAAQAKDIWCC